MLPTPQKPDLRIFRQDTTRHWSADMQARAEKFFDVYIFDKRKHVHCCELTPSYEMNYIGPTWEDVKSDDDEDLCEDVMDAVIDDNTQYVHVSSVKLKDCKEVGLEDSVWVDCLEEAEDDYDTARQLYVEKVSEYCRGNGYVY